MRVHLTGQFLAQFEAAEISVQKAVTKQLKLLGVSLRHPSLHAKKYDEKEDVWQARVNRSWRFYFIIQRDVCRIIEMKAHPK